MILPGADLLVSLSPTTPNLVLSMIFQCGVLVKRLTDSIALGWFDLRALQVSTPQALREYEYRILRRPSSSRQTPPHHEISGLTVSSGPTDQHVEGLSMTDENSQMSYLIRWLILSDADDMGQGLRFLLGVEFSPPFNRIDTRRSCNLICFDRHRSGWALARMPFVVVVEHLQPVL